MQLKFAQRVIALYTSTPAFVRTQAELQSALAQLGNGHFVAVDTEFLRERTYFAQLCLVQLATDDFCALIDVLALQDLRPLFDYLNAPQRTKVLHAAHQDLEVLAFTQGASQGGGALPVRGPFFDTQLAAGLTGHSAQIGYGELVQKCLGHTLTKGHARTDWSRRPLSDEQLHYAADDVLYLVELFHYFEKTLRPTERWAWITEDTQRYEAASAYVTEPADAWERLRGLEQLTPPQRAAAKALAGWREERAVAKNLPRSWILADDILRLLAERLPTTAEELANVPGLSKGISEKRAQEVLSLIAAAAESAKDEAHKPWQRPPRAQVNEVARLMEWVRAEAERLGVSSELLATRRGVEQLVFNGKAGPFGRGWRLDVIGKRLIAEAGVSSAEA